MRIPKYLKPGWAAPQPADDLEHGRVEYPDPIEGTSISMWPTIAAWWDETFGMSTLAMSPRATENVWVANRCVQLNAQQIAAMPLEFHGTFEPAWVSNPDPGQFPNGISDAIFAIVENLYRWGFSIQLITSRYVTGYPATWTVLDSAVVSISVKDGRKEYKAGEKLLDPFDVVQIDRNPSGVGGRLHGTSAISGYASHAWGIVSGGELARSYVSGGAPPAFYLQMLKRITSAQAQEVSNEWAAARASNNGRPPVVPPEIKPEQLSFSPADLLLLEGQEWNARVVATAFGVPATMLNMALQGGLTYQNPGALGEQWYRFELRPTGKRIVDAFSAQMLPRGNWVNLDASDTFAPLTDQSEEDDPQLAEAETPPGSAFASPAQNGNGRPLAAIGGGRS